MDGPLLAYLRSFTALVNEDGPVRVMHSAQGDVLVELTLKPDGILRDVDAPGTAGHKLSLHLDQIKAYELADRIQTLLGRLRNQ